MAFIGGNTEIKEVGLSISLSGTHNNTEIKNGKLTLKSTDVDGNGLPIYAKEGFWTSDAINLGDNFKDFDKVFTTHVNNGLSSFSISTRVSDNNIDWSEWVAIAIDGTIQSETKQYIQVRIDLFAGFVTDSFVISNSDFEENKFVEKTVSDIRLKRDYKFDMSKDPSWAEEGSLHRQKITRDEWLRIDKMNVLRKES